MHSGSAVAVSDLAGRIGALRLEAARIGTADSAQRNEEYRASQTLLEEIRGVKSQIPWRPSCVKSADGRPQTKIACATGRDNPTPNRRRKTFQT